jgi:hypothetical protein
MADGRRGEGERQSGAERLRAIASGLTTADCHPADPIGYAAGNQTVRSEQFDAGRIFRIEPDTLAMRIGAVERVRDAVEGRHLMVGWAPIEPATETELTVRRSKIEQSGIGGSGAARE